MVAQVPSALTNPAYITLALVFGATAGALWGGGLLGLVKEGVVTGVGRAI